MRRFACFWLVLLIVTGSAAAGVVLKEDDRLDFNGVTYHYTYVQQAGGYTVTLTAPDGRVCTTVVLADGTSTRTGSVGLDDDDMLLITNTVAVERVVLPEEEKNVVEQVVLTLLLVVVFCFGVFVVLKRETVSIWGLERSRKGKPDKASKAMLVKTIIFGVLVMFMAVGFLTVVWG